MAVKNHTFTDDGRTYFYIHRHLEHFEKDAAISLFQSQKQQNYLEMKNRYKKNYLSNISGISDEALKILDAAMREDEIISGLDADLLEILNKRISEGIQSYNLDSKLSTAYNSLNNFLRSKDAKDLDRLFTQITKATELLNTNISGLLALIGPRGEYKKHRDLTKLSTLLQQEVAKYEGKVLNVNQKRLASITRSLSSLVSNLSSGENINKQSLQRYLSNIFSTQIGEYIVSKGVAKGLDLGLKEIRNSLTGATNITVDEGDEELQNFIKSYGQSGSQVFKTDNSFQDLEITLEDGNTFNINLGLSTKWYKGNGGSADSVAITTEVSFLNRINQLLDSENDKYYVYNSLGLVGQDDSMYSALKAAMVARNLDVMMSGLGPQGDFSQYIIINGEFYSIWQIILALENFNHGQGSYGKGDATDPVTISATGLKAVSDITEQVKDNPNNLIAAYIRSKIQNRMIENLGLSGHFYPNRLKNILVNTK